MQQTIVHIQQPGDVANLTLLIQGVLSGEITSDDCPDRVTVTDWLKDGTSQSVEVPTDFTDIRQRGWDQLLPMLEEMAAGNLETSANNFTSGITFVPFTEESNV
jgi:hypothetical protein